ncbi:uncharacterized protein [Apostichopus japonicus]|uniref:uncharacterized protein n=1 Tax=Stichopus japonicus TaxID=307972 RepID=UPI003AB68D12
MGRKTVFVVFVIAGTLIGYINAQNCTSTECSKSYFDPDLIITPDKGCYSNTEQVSISCNGDFGGPTFNQCNGGTWMLPSSTCDVFTCQPPTVGDNLNISPVKSEYTAREVITFTCDQGYSLTGTSSAQCDQANVWNPSTVPVCIASCDEPTIANGGLTSTGPYNDGDTAEVQCNDGYNIESGFSSIIDCDDGAWGTIPRCLGSCNISAVPNSDTPPSGVNIVHGESYTIDCFGDHSYNLEVSFTVTCDDGVLSSTVPPSCYADCSSLDAPVYGTVSSGVQHGQTVYYSCNRGFALNGTSSATCSNGVWSDTSTPVCTGQSLEDSISLYCNSDKFIVEIPGELLGDNPGLGSVLLGTCEGSYYDGQYLFANSSYTACGTTIEVDETNEMVIYRNTLKSADNGVVTTEDYIEINTECVFDQNNLVSSSAVVQGVISKALASNAQYDISFGAYLLSDFSETVSDGVRVDTNTDIYLLSEVNQVAMVDLFPKRCYATPQPESNFHQYHDLIDDGCPASSYVDDIRSDATVQPNVAFRVRVFRFTNTDSDSIYIHCELKVCPVGDCPLPSSCSTRKRRSSQITFTKHVSAGPIKLREDETIGGSSSSWLLPGATIFSSVMSMLLLSVVAIMGVYILRQRTTKSAREDAGTI